MSDSKALCQSLNGSEHDAEALLQLLYQELKKLARSRISRLPPGQTLQPTALVHEAYLRIIGREDLNWNGRAHFFAAASRAMRDIVVESARRKSRFKHGGGLERQAVDREHEIPIPIAIELEDIVAIDEALTRMSEKHERKAKVVELRYFAGLGFPEIAQLLDVSARTIEADWRFARA